MKRFHFAIGYYLENGEIMFWNTASQQILHGTIEDANAYLAQAEFNCSIKYSIFKIELSEYKIISKPKRKVTLADFGYAPGEYSCACFYCFVQYEGDKRSSVCPICAAKRMEDYLQEK